MKTRGDANPPGIGACEEFEPRTASPRVFVMYKMQMLRKAEEMSL